jgi:hypothetical protein
MAEGLVSTKRAVLRIETVFTPQAHGFQSVGFSRDAPQPIRNPHRPHARQRDTIDAIRDPTARHSVRPIRVLRHPARRLQ